MGIAERGSYALIYNRAAYIHNNGALECVQKPSKAQFPRTARVLRPCWQRTNHPLKSLALHISCICSSSAAVAASPAFPDALFRSPPLNHP
jgi:hypothetical protein